MTKARPYLQEYSVFARILAELGQQPVYNAVNFNLPLNDFYLFASTSGVSANTTCIQTTLAVLLCPSDVGGITSTTGPTNYRANIGSSLTWADGEVGAHFPNGGTPEGGPFGANAAATTDGLSNTVAFSEKLVGRQDSSAFEPRTGMVKGFIDPSSVVQSIDLCAGKTSAPLGFFACSGLTWFTGSMAQTQYSQCVPPNSPISDCLSGGVNPPLGVITARSNHAGGVNVSMTDGSVRFVSAGITVSVWRALGTRGSGEAFVSP
jgi:prepilin-type processing-associated H-X9-DG protein